MNAAHSRKLHGEMLSHGAPFLWRLLLPFLVAGVMIYRLDGQTWAQSFLNAAMLLGGMGPVGDMHNDVARVLAGVYALSAGLVFVLIAGVMLHPVMLEAVRRYHLEGPAPRRGERG